jgi:hypothetical protein
VDFVVGQIEEHTAFGFSSAYLGLLLLRYLIASDTFLLDRLKATDREQRKTAPGGLAGGVIEVEEEGNPHDHE